MAKSSIYTFTGDNGTTSLVGGQRVSKTDCRLEAYGTIDELNSFVGLLAASPEITDDCRPMLIDIQNRLFNVGAYLATDNSATPDALAMGVDDDKIKALEAEIDRIDEQLPKHFRFTLPGGSDGAARAHVCRTVTRRCERRILTLAATAPVNACVVKYINRLSDYFYVLARFIAINSENGEIFWNKDC